MKVVLRDLYSTFAEKVGTSIPDKLLEFARAIGVDGFDIHHPEFIPGWSGYEDRAYKIFLTDLKKRLKNYSLSVNSIGLPSPSKFLVSESDEEINMFCSIIKSIGETSIPMANVNLNLDVDTFKWHIQKEQKGGYKMSSFNIQHMINNLDEEKKDKFSAENLWPRRVEFYKKIIPVAEEHNVKLALHPPDPPVPDHLIAGRIGLLDWNRIIWEVPSEFNGVKYCVGTRYESGINVIDEIRHFGRKNKIFNVHFRNVRGTIPSGGAYEEVLLDDGDMSMFKVLSTLEEVGYDGPICPDHVPVFRDDELERRIGRAYSVGYMKALISALKM